MGTLETQQKDLCSPENFEKEQKVVLYICKFDALPKRMGNWQTVWPSHGNICGILSWLISKLADQRWSQAFSSVFKFLESVIVKLSIGARMNSSHKKSDIAGFINKIILL